MNSLVIVPEKESEMVGRSIEARLPAIVDLIRADGLTGLIDGGGLELLTRLTETAAAREALLWGRAERGYEVAWTSLAPWEDVVGTASADPAQGLVWQVFDANLSGLQTANELRADEWTNLERRRGRTLGGMAGSPIFAAGRCVAVLTLAQYREDGADVTLTRRDAAVLAGLAALLGRSLEDQLIRALLGLKAL